jgi:hypothetical protein
MTPIVGATAHGRPRYVRRYEQPRYRSTRMGLLSEIVVFASDNGEGIVGETDDRLITFFSLGVVAFFIVTVIVLSALQAWLDRRKEQRKAAELRRRVGW